MDQADQILVAHKAALARLSQMSAAERRACLQSIGLIDERGRLTKQYGGEDLVDRRIGENLSLSQGQNES